MSDDMLNGAAALITGAGSGIGEATAHRLAARGCRVICAGRRLERLQGVARALVGDALATPLDVTDPQSVSGLLQRLPQGWRDIDILVNGAGHDVGGRTPFVEGESAGWTDIIETNVNGLLRVTRALLPGMLERGRGHVVNIGSVAAVRPYAGGGPYAASKAAVHAFSECLRLECRETRVRVSEILPGLVRTEFAERRWGDASRAKAFYEQPADVLEADDVARAVVYMLEQPPHVNVSQMLVLPSSQV